jgi:hypothetical protein
MSMKQFILNPLAILGVVLAVIGSERTALAAGTTQTVTYTAGTPGTQYHAQFSWTVTNVTAKGTFVDGSPWIRVAAGAQLIAVSPVSERRTTSSGFQVTINGSAKNPKMQAHYDPDTLQTFLPAKQLFDSRRIFLRPPTNQATIDAAFDFAANIGAVNPSTGAITPVPLAAGDVIVTAKSQWIASRPGTWGSGGSLPHVGGGRRTAIDRFGVLTVLAATPAAASFRPPLQWIIGAESTRPAPIPVSSVITNDSALMHPSLGSLAGVDLLLAGPTFHDGDGILYQSSHAQHAFSADPKLQGTITYGGTMAKAVLRKVLFAATDSGLAPATRTMARNRLIQYGIDSHGAAMALGRTSAGAGQRAAEMKPWIMLAGWWLNRAEMKNPYQSIRNLYAGRAVASLDDVSLGRLLFHDDTVARQIVGGMSLGAPYHQAWGPGQPFAVTSSSNATSVRLLDAGTLFGQFGRMEISGASQHPSQHAKSPNCYYGCYLRVESGPGAGSTVYRVIEVGNVNGGIGSFVTVDRPWVQGLPGPSSTVRMFPFMNSDFVPGLGSDIGRWYYSTNGQSSQRSVDSLSPMANGYARISFKALLVPYAALKRLVDVTGDKNYLRGATWNMLSEYVGGSGNSLVTGQLAGGTPNSDRIMNQIWPSYRHVGLRAEELATVRGWIGDNGTPSGFGFIDRSRIPGTVTNETAIASVTPCATAAPCTDGVNLLETSPGEDLAVSAGCVVHSVGWYTYSPTASGPVTVNTSGGSAFDTRLAVVSGCDGSVLYGCNDNVGGAGGSWSEVTFAGTVGETYYLAVGGSSPDAFGTVIVNVLGPSSEDDDDDEGDEDGDDEDGHDGDDEDGGEGEFHDPFDQDDGAGYSLCETAPQVGEGATTLVIEPELDIELPNDCGGGPDGFNHVRNPKVFRFVPAVAAAHTVSLCGGTSVDTRLMILSGCSGTVIACSDDAPGCGDASETSFDASAGVEYLIVVGSKHADDVGAALMNITAVGGESGPRRMLMCVGSSSLANPAGTPGLTGLKRHDVVLRDQEAGTWSMHFDGSDVGLGSWGIDALARLDDGSLVMSFDKNVNLPGLVGGPSGLAVDRCDLVRFVPTSTGWNTAGQWHFWFDGSDVGLSGGGEDIDAVDVLANGDIVLSTKSKASVTGISNFPAQGLLRFAPTSLGAVTAGSWHVHLDGPDVGLSVGSENIDAVSIGPGGRLTLSTTGNFEVGGVSGGGGDGFGFFPTTLGWYSSGMFAPHFVGGQAGLGGSGKLNAIAELPNP